MITINLSIYCVVWDYEGGGEQEPQQGYQEHNLELEKSRDRI